MQEYKNIELKDILIKFSEYKEFLFEKKKNIFYTCIIFLLIGFFVSLSSQDKYNAELTFVVENTGNSGASVVSGIASQFGLNMSQGDITFSQQNVLEMLKSRGVISSTLLKESTIDKKKTSLITHYLIINDREDLVSDKFSNRIKYENDGSIFEDSVLTLVYNQIIKEKLEIKLQTNDANIIRLSYKSYSQEFGKYFVENLIDEMGRMYTLHRTSQAERTLNFLKNRADSIFRELQSSEESFARVKDINSRIVKASGRLQELQLRRDVEVLNTIYLEIVKNLELSKISLLDNTPIINIIDKPIFPLPVYGYSMTMIMIIYFLLGLFISTCYIILDKLFQDSSAEL